MALRNACTELLEEIRTKGEAHALAVEYHIVSAWASSLLKDPDRLSAAAVAAQHEFSVYEINAQWLSALNDLILFGGESVDSFVKTLCRFYLFNLSQVEDILWQQYSNLQQKVLLETGRRLPGAWGEWHSPMQVFMHLFAQHLAREDPDYGRVLTNPAARDLVDVTPSLPLSGEAIPELPSFSASDIDETAALTTYLEWLLEQHGPLEAGGSLSWERYGPRLSDIFVPRRLCRANDWEEVRGYARYHLIKRRRNTMREWPVTRAPHTLPADDGTPASRPVTQVLDEVSRLVVMAGPGEGKTTLLRHLTMQHASLMLAELDESPPLGHLAHGPEMPEPNHRLPIYLHIAEYAENAALDEEDLLEYALRTLAESDLRDPSVPAVIRHLVEKGRCVFLLDGLDTIGDGDQRQAVAARISQLAAERCSGSRGNQILVACRPAGYETAPLSADFETYVLDGLSGKEIGKYLMRFFLATERARRPMLADEALRQQAEHTTRSVRREILAHDTLRALATNPLFLRVMAERQREGAYLLPQRVGLLRSAAEAMIREWRLPRGPTHTPQVQESEVVELLSHLAYWLQGHRASGVASKQEIVERLCDIWLERHLEADLDCAHEAIDDFLAQVRHQANMLIEVRPRHYRFVHPSMQEYFAARYLVARHRVAAGRLREHLHDPRWDESVRLAIGFEALDSPRNASDLLESAILGQANGVGGEAFPPSPFEDLLKRDLLFAGSLLADGIEASPGLTRTIVHHVVDLWRRGDRDSAGRFDIVFNRARQLLVALDGTAAGQVALHYTLSFAQDSRPHVRAFVADALTFWPSHMVTALETLVELGRDNDSLVRRAVAEALGRAQVLTPRAHVLLITLVSDPDRDVREVARRSLAKAGPVPEATMRIWVQMLQEDDESRRELGAKILGRVGTLPPVVVGELLALLADSAPNVRNAVAETLATLETLPDDALAAICRAIGDAELETKVAGIEALARPVELPANVVNQLIAWSHEADPQVRLAATRALDTCRNKTEPVIEALTDRTEDDVFNIQATAVVALGRKGAGNHRVAHTLAHFATAENPGLKISAAEAFGYLEDLSSEMESYLVGLLRDFHVGVREAAMRAAARLGHPYPKVVQRLIDMTTDDDPGEAVRAGRTLSRLYELPPAARRALLRLLPLHPDLLAGDVAVCLYRHSPLTLEEIETLTSLASEGAATVRRVAIRTMGLSLHAVTGVMDELLQLMADADETIRAEAVASLAAARDIADRAIDGMFDMLDGEAPPVREAAAVTLTKLSRSLPHLGWDGRRMEFLTDQIFHLLDRTRAQDCWEPEADAQNALLLALSWLAPRYGPEL